MVINVFGAIVMVSIYWAIWYAVGASRRQAKAGSDNGLKRLWTFNAFALFGSGALFVAAALINANVNQDATGQGIAAVVTVIVLGMLGLTATKRTVKVKAAEVAAAKVPGKIPSGYTVKTAPDPQPTTYVPSFAEKIGASRAENIIAEIKGGSW